MQPTLLEVAPAQTNGNPLDTGLGAFARPDPQITLMRDAPQALKEATELFVQATERKVKELGQPIDARFKKLLAKQAMLTLRCGVAIAAMEDQPLTAARNQFAADSKVASDAILSKPVDGGLRVSLGDKISIFVNDADLASHDLMGETEIEITEELLTKGEVELIFHSVESLRLKLTPIKK